MALKIPRLTPTGYGYAKSAGIYSQRKKSDETMGKVGGMPVNHTLVEIVRDVRATSNLTSLMKN